MRFGMPVLILPSRTIVIGSGTDDAAGRIGERGEALARDDGESEALMMLVNSVSCVGLAEAFTQRELLAGAGIVMVLALARTKEKNTVSFIVRAQKNA